MTLNQSWRKSLIGGQVQRAVCACTIACPDKIGQVYDALFHAFWFEKKGVQLAEVYESILRSILGNELGDRVMDMACESVSQFLSIDED
jgi:hypothetical protein